MKLDDIAEILRFQDRREPAHEGEEAEAESLVYHEAKPDDFDSAAGFLLPDGMSLCGLFRKPGRYALRKGDILMFFNGSHEKIGLCGLVIDDVLAVPARVLCIIRPYAVPPAALFMYLRTAEIRSDIQKLAAFNNKTKKAFVNLESLRKFGIDPVFVNEMKEKEEQCAELISFYRETRKKLDGKIYAIQRDLLHAWPE